MKCVIRQTVGSRGDEMADQQQLTEEARRNRHIRRDSLGRRSRERGEGNLSRARGQASIAHTQIR